MSNCNDLLKDGVYSKHNLTKTSNHNVDYKHYFSSDEFRNDFLNKNIGFDVEVFISGMLVSLGYDSSETEVREFQKKVRESTDFKINDNFFLSVADSFVDKTLMDAYVACKNTTSLGFVITHSTTDDTISFKVTYNNFGSLQSPILENVYLSTGGKLLHQTLKIGERLENNAQSSFTFELNKNKKEILFIIDTDISSQAEKVILQKKGDSNDSSPVGTIIASYLNWEKFQVATESNKYSGSYWKSEFSFWSPCDGRSVPKSTFEHLTSETIIPDLRGIFLRGLNTFDAVGEMGDIRSVSEMQKDPDDRIVGSFQKDDLKSHDHSYFGSLSSSPIRGSGGGAPENPSYGTTGKSGGTETRPKNIAIYYYIRIN